MQKEIRKKLQEFLYDKQSYQYQKFV